MKVFTASGILYTAGYKVGTSNYTIADDYIPELVKKSPTLIPVVSDLGRVRDPESVIGMGTLEYIPQNGDTPACIRAHSKFNQNCKKEYETLLQGSKDRKSLHLGFWMTRVNLKSEDKQLLSGVISALALGTDCLGGIIDKFGWEVMV